MAVELLLMWDLVYDTHPIKPLRMINNHAVVSSSSIRLSL